MRIALFFGSFDPVHTGHLAIANYVREFTPVDRVWFVVSPQSPFKTGRRLTSGEHRLEMLRLALEGAPDYGVCDIELHLPRPSYTYRTLQALSEKYPQHKFVLLMGGDNLPDLPRWKNAGFITENYEIYVYPRPGYTAELLSQRLEGEEFFHNKKIKIIPAPLLDISATFIRQSIMQGKDMRFFLHPEVYKYIRENRLYISV